MAEPERERTAEVGSGSPVVPAVAGVGPADIAGAEFADTDSVGLEVEVGPATSAVAIDLQLAGTVAEVAGTVAEAADIAVVVAEVVLVRQFCIVRVHPIVVLREHQLSFEEVEGVTSSPCSGFSEAWEEVHRTVPLRLLQQPGPYALRRDFYIAGSQLSKLPSFHVQFL